MVYIIQLGKTKSDLITVIRGETEVKPLNDGRKKSVIIIKREFRYPDEYVELIDNLKISLSLLHPTCKNALINFKTLIRIFGNKDFIEDVIGGSIKNAVEDASALYIWKVLLNELGCADIVIKLNSMIDEASKKLQLEVDDLDKEFLIESKRKFNEKRRLRIGSKDEMLTEVRFNETITSIITKELGVEYELFEMINSDYLRPSVIKVTTHNKILKILQTLGFASLGMSGQKAINKSYLSKNAFGKFLLDPPMGSPKKLCDLIMCEFADSELLHICNLWVKDNYRKGKGHNELSSWLVNNILDTSSLQKEEIKCSKLESILKKCNWRLDEWQRVFIEHIKEGNSVMAFVPTSGGKTFASMSAIEYIFKANDTNRTVAYIAPKVDLALQTYNNIKATFTNRSVALVTGRISIIPEGAQIWVGTPIELWTYMNTMGIRFSIGIFDEIHTISTSFGVGKEARLRAEATGNLLSLCDDQVIGLSATIHSEDREVLRYFVSLNNRQEPILDEFIKLCNYSMNDSDLYRTMIRYFVSLMETTLHDHITRFDALSNDETFGRSLIEFFIELIETMVIESKREILSDINKLYESKEANDTQYKEFIYQFICMYFNLKTIKQVIYLERTIPQENYMWNGNTCVSMTSDTEFMSTPVTPEATFDFLRDIVRFLKTNEDKKQAPVLIFEATPKECFDNFNDYIKWIEKEETNVYDGWYKAQREINADIENLNGEMYEYYMAYSEAKNKSDEKMNKILPRVREYAKKRDAMIDLVCKNLRTIIRNRFESNISSKYMIETPGFVRDLCGCTEVPKNVSVEIVDLCRELHTYMRVRKYDDTHVESVGSLPRVCQGIGSFFRVGESSEHINRIKSMFNPRSYSNGEKERNEMLHLCESEHIREKEVKPLFELICKGLEYGIGIILPNMPFVVHYNMLKLLKSKDITAIFTSHDMSMGINYPIRMVCIRSNEPIYDMNICEYLQMAGRSGRRGKDKIGYVVAWNIGNAATAGQDTLPRIQLPNVGLEYGCQLSDPLKIAIEIDLNRFYSLGSTDLTGVVDGMGYSKVENVKTQQAVVIDHSDDESDDDTEEKKPIVKSIVESTEAMGNEEQAITSVISGCISPLVYFLGMSDEELITIAERVHRISRGDITEDMKVDAYDWSDKIGLVKKALQELHTRMHRSNNTEWMTYVTSVFELLHRVQLRQMRL